MGQIDPGGQHQGRVIRATPAKYSVTPRSANQIGVALEGKGYVVT